MNFQDGGTASLWFDWVFFSLKKVTWRAVSFLILSTLSWVTDLALSGVIHLLFDWDGRLRGDS